MKIIQTTSIEFDIPADQELMLEFIIQNPGTGWKLCSATSDHVIYSKPVTSDNVIYVRQDQWTLEMPKKEEE